MGAGEQGLAGDAGVSEQVLLLGPRKALVGVLTQPAGGAAPGGRPLVVILNAGVIHRVGPNRMHVAMARTMAREGYVVLRFDLSGVGDSAPREEGLAPFESAMADVREVLDSLQATRGPVQVVLVGLCSGADQSVFYAGRDPRVVGAVLIDPSVPRTRRFYLNHYGRRMLRARSWVNVLSGRHEMFRAARGAPDMVTQASSAMDAAMAAQIDAPETRALLEQAYQGAVDQGVRMLVACTADRETRLNYREQLLEALPNVRFGDRLQLEWFAGADHTFTMEAERSALLGLIVQWMREGWGAGVQAAA